MSPETAEKSGPTSQPYTVGRVERWKLTEPVRLYLWPLLVLQLLGGIAGGLVAQDWAWSLLSLAGAVGLFLTDAARSSVYSTAGVVRELRRPR